MMSLPSALEAMLAVEKDPFMKFTSPPRNYKGHRKSVTGYDFPFFSQQPKIGEFVACHRFSQGLPRTGENHARGAQDVGKDSDRAPPRRLPRRVGRRRFAALGGFGRRLGRPEVFDRDP